ncbi:MAG: peptide protein [Spirosoma sp.]|nr:peptide protein [Spirosoma sp.]
MKFTRLLLPLLLLFVALVSFAPKDNSDAVVGTWLNGTKKGHIQIYKQGGTYFGKLVYLTEPNDPATGKPKTDFRNTDAAKRARPLLNMVLMYNFKYDEGNVWSDGKIYNPEDGKEYNCKMTLVNPNTLEVRGYVGISLLGKTQTWTRIK